MEIITSPISNTSIISTAMDNREIILQEVPQNFIQNIQESDNNPKTDAKPGFAKPIQIEDNLAHQSGMVTKQRHRIPN